MSGCKEPRGSQAPELHLQFLIFWNEIVFDFAYTYFFGIVCVIQAVQGYFTPLMKGAECPKPLV